jgi:hypothetical protein
LAPLTFSLSYGSSGSLSERPQSQGKQRKNPKKFAIQMSLVAPCPISFSFLMTIGKDSKWYENFVAISFSGFVSVVVHFLFLHSGKPLSDSNSSVNAIGSALEEFARRSKSRVFKESRRRSREVCLFFLLLFFFFGNVFPITLPDSHLISRVQMETGQI